jgi:hypothetical protein
MTLAALNTSQAADPFTAVRALSRMKAAGFALTVRADKLVVIPADRLSEPQRAYLRSHKPALVALLEDAETLHAALVRASTNGLGWREGTPGDWSDARLLAAGEVLYGHGRMVNRLGRRYRTEVEPAPTEREPIPDPVYGWRRCGLKLEGGGGFGQVERHCTSWEAGPPFVAPVDNFQPFPPLVCRWNAIDRLIAKCSAPEPNADGSGCANCGSTKL